MSQGTPKVSQKGAKGSQKGAKREPKGAKSEPGGAKREPKVSQIQHKINIKDKVTKSEQNGLPHHVLFGAVLGAFFMKNL